MSIKTFETSDGESYSAMSSVVTNYAHTHLFVSHNEITGINRLNIIAGLYSVTVYMTDSEAMELSVMLADSVKSAQKEEA